MKRQRRFEWALILGCLCFVAGGCQWAMSVNPGDMTVQPGRPVEIKILASRAYNVPGPNGVIVRPFSPPAHVRIRFATGETWTRPAIRRLDPYHYVYTFRGTISEPTTYSVDPNAPIIRLVGKGAGPYNVATEPNDAQRTPSEQGFQSGREHRSGGLPTYRLVIVLRDSRLSAAGRDAFLKGFLHAYEEVHNVAEGRRYTDVLRDAIMGSTFDQAYQDGVRHANNQVNDGYIQTLMGNAGGAGGSALAWKAGYIDGFASQLLAKNTAIDREEAFQQAETMYNTLRRGMGL